MGLTFNTKFEVEKLNKNLKTRNRVYIIATLLTILMLLPYIPFWFNITKAMETFGIGQFHTEKEYLKIYGNETAGVYIQLDIKLRTYSDTDIVSGEKVSLDLLFFVFCVTKPNNVFYFDGKLPIHHNDISGCEFCSFQVQVGRCIDWFVEFQN